MPDSSSIRDVTVEFSWHGGSHLWHPVSGQAILSRRSINIIEAIRRLRNIGAVELWEVCQFFDI